MGNGKCFENSEKKNIWKYVSILESFDENVLKNRIN